MVAFFNTGKGQVVCLGFAFFFTFMAYYMIQVRAHSHSPLPQGNIGVHLHAAFAQTAM